MKTVQQCLDFVRDSLGKLFSPSEIREISYALAECVTEMPLSKLLISKDIKLSENQVKKIESFVARLKNGEPLQYVLGYAVFCGHTFGVNSSTLIPRPETAELVDWVVKSVNDHPKILDIGTGSGCIAISLKCAISSAKIVAVDISDEALKTAKENAKKNGVDVDFRKVDILTESAKIIDEFDIIVSNPPYICECEKKNMQRNVLDFEPSTALFVPDKNPLLFYETIADFAKTHLRKNGNLFFEINQKFPDEMCEMLRQKGFTKIELRKDFYGNDRMIKVRNEE